MNCSGFVLGVGSSHRTENCQSSSNVGLLTSKPLSGVYATLIQGSLLQIWYTQWGISEWACQLAQIIRTQTTTTFFDHQSLHTASLYIQVYVELEDTPTERGLI